MRLTNPTREAISVLVKGEPKDGDAPTESIAPGETKNVNVDPENPTIKGMLFAGALVAEDEPRRSKAVAQEQP
jgi:hypothetical protein